jgi:hypothetical protein
MSKEVEAAALAAQKQKLVREGELYRIKVVHAKALVTNALHPDALFHGARRSCAGHGQGAPGRPVAAGRAEQAGGLGGVNFKS